MQRLRTIPREYWYAGLLVLLTLFSIGLDVYELATEGMDPNRIPFIPFPLVLLFFALLLVYLHTRRPLPTKQ